ncbi:MAG: GNAT family N-acetyltransferase [Bacteroidetes bacterium]|nr:GNAT family N-acetyltransferase [Bacteroidota bacterium]
MKDLQIRTPGPDDIPAIHELVGDLARYEKAEEEFVASLETYRQDFADGIFEVILAETDQTIVGMALYYMTYSTWKGRMLHLEDFIVKSKWRRKGIGEKLFDAFMEEAWHRNCSLIKWQVLDWNEPALRFYKKKQAIIEKNWWNGKIFRTDKVKKPADPKKN